MKGRYTRSKLGIVWMIIHPLAQAAVLALVLSQLLGARFSGINSDYGYAVYLLSGVVAWNFFAETISSGISMFRERANLLKKVHFPRVCIPLIVAGTAVINHLIFLTVVVSIVWLLGITPGSALLILPFAMLIILGMAMALGLILSVFDVFNRDVGNVWNVVINFWFWLTPIVYSKDVLPSHLESILYLNPVYPIISAYQQAIAYGETIDIASFFKTIAIMVVLLIIGFFLFLRSSKDVVDEL